MLEFAKWVGQDFDHFFNTLVFIGIVCYFLSWPLRALRGGKRSAWDLF